MSAAIVGDITPVDGVSNEEKYRLENEAMQQIRALLGPETAAGECRVLAMMPQYPKPESESISPFFSRAGIRRHSRTVQRGSAQQSSMGRAAGGALYSFLCDG